MRKNQSLPRQLLALVALLPLLAGCTLLSGNGTTLNVKDFGAKGDGKTDDSQAFQDVLKKAATVEGHVTIRIPDGEYKLTLPENSETKAQFQLENLSDVTVAADNQALLVFGSLYHHGIGLYKCKNVTLKNLAIDFDPLPITQGTIVDVNLDQNTIDIRVDEGFPLPTEPHIDGFVGRKNKTIGYTYDRTTRRKLNEFGDQYINKKTEKVSPGIYRLHSGNPKNMAMIGKAFAICGRRKANALKIDASKDCLLQNIQVYTAPACGYHIANSEGIVINKSAIKQRPGTTRMMSTVADGLHDKWSTVGPTLSNSYFTGMGDDSVNIGGSYVPILDQIDDHTIIVENHGSLRRKDMDLVGISLETNAHFPYGPLAKSENTSRIKGYNKPCLKLTFKNKLPKLVTWKESMHPRKCSQVLNLNACGRDSKILNNHFYSHRVRGVLMRGPNGLIKGNHFDTLAGPAICVSNDGGFLTEGPSGDGTVIEDNTFTHIERSNICVYSSFTKAKGKATEGIVGLKIINNRFDDYGGDNIYGRGIVGNVMSIKNADNVLIEGNKIGKPVDPKLDVKPILLGSNGKVTWKDNTIQGRPLDLEKDSNQPE